ncbi:MAG: hypothetical protein QM751_02855 [Paludibacteraceae bacterium]
MSILPISGILSSQNIQVSTEEIITNIYEQLSEDSETEIDFTGFFEDLMWLVENPIQLNHTNREELEKLQFLSDTQIDNILYYLYRNAPMNTMYELQLIDGLDMTDIRNMLPFIALGKAEDNKTEFIRFSDIIKYGKNELYARLDKGLETKEGYRFDPEENQNTSENTKKYIGDPFYTQLKYRFNYKEKIQIGITVEKDAGEQFWGKYHKGYDFYSAYFQLKNFGRFKTLVVGDYKANFGQGLVFHSDFSMGKSAYVTNVKQQTSGLKKYSSTNEYNFFRGAGATLRFGKIDITSFYSTKNVDADTINGTISSIKTDGLHRTLNDLSKKNTANQQTIGSNVKYQQNWFQLGATFVYTYLNHSLIPNETNYNLFYFKGKNQSAASIDYKVRWQKLNFFGETAITGKSAIATINGLHFSPISTVSLVALYRCFSPKYDVFFSNTFSESSTVNNEKGIYLGAEIRPIKYWKVSAYVDNYQFPWPRFGVDAPSLGKDYLMQADYFPKRNVSMYWRFKYESKEQNYADATSVMPVVLFNPRWQARYKLSYEFGNFIFRNQIDVNSANDGVNKPTYGYSALQDINYNISKIPLGINLRLHIFDAQAYTNRIYVYEQDVLYAFSVPMIYGMGMRYYLNLKYDVTKAISIWLKLAQTTYSDDRESVSSGNEEITGNRKTDFRLLLRWKF